MLRIAAVLSSLLLLAACNWSPGELIIGSGNLKTETRQVENFTAIVVSGTANIEIEQTGEESLQITTDDNLLPLYTTEVRNGTLYIEFAEGKRLSWSRSGNVPRITRIKVTVRDLHQLTVSGAARIKATNLDTDSLSITVSGSGSLDAVDLRAKRATIVVSGAGEVTVNANEELDARVSGVGTIWYVGSPKLQSKVSGVGSVKQKFITH